MLAVYFMQNESESVHFGDRGRTILKADRCLEDAQYWYWWPSQDGDVVSAMK